MTGTDKDYIISGGAEGKERLHVLAEVLRPYTSSLLEMDGPISGKKFLDLGCGGGDVALMAAKMVGEAGDVTAIDFDAEIIALAREDAAKQGIQNISFHAKSAYDISFHQEFDIAYSRFLLSHLQQPSEVLQKMVQSIRAGGRIIVEDVQFSGHFCYPSSKAFQEYLRYYATAACKLGQNPEIGPSLFSLFQTAGIENTGFDVIQPCFHTGPGKWMAWITMDKIKQRLMDHDLADLQTLSDILQELEAFTKDEQSIISLPRIFRIWGYKS